jgi:predicted flap endonuclease-1-like 5' DNA nuclease
MSWATDISDYDPSDLRRQTERAMSFPLGLANPFWLVFGAAAATGAAWWWMSRLARQANLAAAAEAANVYEMAEATAATAPLTRARGAAAPPKPAPAPKAAPQLIDPAEDLAVADKMFENAEATGYPRVVLEPQVPDEARTAEPEAEIPAETADDFTRLVGVGPRIAAALAARGVTRFVQLAAWGKADLAAFDKELNLKGRAQRSDWIDQARRLAAD